MRTHAMTAAGLALALVATRPHEARAAKKATFVEIDAHLGMATPTHEQMGVALSYGGMIGIGGKLKAFPPRFYLMAGVLHQGFRADGLHPLTGQEYTARQSLLDISIGLRIVVPIYKGLRIYADVMALASRQKYEVVRAASDSRLSTYWTPGGVVALGIQYRWHRNASTGLRLEGTFYGKLDSAAMSTVDLDPDHNGKLVLALIQAWYF